MNVFDHFSDIIKAHKCVISAKRTLCQNRAILRNENDSGVGIRVYPAAKRAGNHEKTRFFKNFHPWQKFWI